MSVDPNILIVIATLVSLFGFSSTVSGWVSGVRPWVAIASFLIGVGILLYLHLSLPDGLILSDIPNAYVHVAAMILN